MSSNVFPPEAMDALNDLDAALGDGNLIGVIGQTDFDFLNDVTLNADGRVNTSVRAPGGDNINGQAKSTGQYSLFVRWLDEDSNLIREEGIISNVSADEWRNYSLDPKSPFADIVVEDDSGSDQTVNMSTHYK